MSREPWDRPPPVSTWSRWLTSLEIPAPAMTTAELEDFAERLAWAHGASRVKFILLGYDYATNKDIGAWRAFGRRRR